MKACGCGHIRVVLLKIHSGLMVVRMEELLKTVRCCLPIVWMTTHVKPLCTLFVKSKRQPGATRIKENVGVPLVLVWIQITILLGKTDPTSWSRENPYQIPSGPRTDVFLFLKQTPTRQKTNLMLAFRVCFGDRLCLVGTVCL